MKPVVITLTKLEAEVLLYAAQSVRDDLTSTFLKVSERSAWRRAHDKLRAGVYRKDLP